MTIHIAASFVAVSSKPQAADDKSSIEDQAAAIDIAAAELGVRIGYRLTVPGESRNIPSLEEAARKIEAYAQLIELCEANAIQLLITDRMDRLGRDMVLILQIIAKCHRHDVAVYDASNRSYIRREDDRLSTIIQAYTADKAVRQTAVNVMRGRRNRARDGKFPSKPPYGYKYIFDESGHPMVTTVQSEIDAVRHIVDLYMANNGSNIITRSLDNDYPRPDGQRWSSGSVHRILKSIRIYAGFVKFAGHWHVGQNPAVMSLDEVEAIEAEVRARAQNKNYGRGAHLFSRMIICEQCQRIMVIKKGYKIGKPVRIYYRCQNCHRSIVESKIKKFVIAELGKIADGEIEAKQIEHIDPTVEKIRMIESRLIEIDSALQRLDARYVSGRLTEERYDSLLLPMESEKKTLADELAKLESNQVPQRHIDLDAEAVAMFIWTMDNLPEKETNAILRTGFKILFNGETRRMSLVRME